MTAATEAQGRMLYAVAKSHGMAAPTPDQLARIDKGDVNDLKARLECGEDVFAVTSAVAPVMPLARPQFTPTPPPAPRSPMPETSTLRDAANDLCRALDRFVDALGGGR